MPTAPDHWWAAWLTIQITPVGLAAIIVLVIALVALAALTGYQHGHRRGLQDAYEPQEPPYRRYRGS